MWFFLALLAGFLFATNRLMIRSILTRGGNPIAFLAVHNTLAGIVLLPLALLYFTPPQTYEHWIYLLLSTLALFLADLFGFLSLRKIEASMVQIIGQLRHIIILVGGYTLFAEPIRGSKVIGIVLITLGVVVAVLEKTGLKLNRGIVYAALNAFFISIMFLCVKFLSADLSIAFLASFGFIASGIMAYLLLLARKEFRGNHLPTKNPSQLIIAAAIFGIYELTFFAALATGEVSKATPVLQSSMIFTLIGGYLFLRERQRIQQKIIGGALIALGIILLYLF